MDTNKDMTAVAFAPIFAGGDQIIATGNTTGLTGNGARRRLRHFTSRLRGSFS